MYQCFIQSSLSNHSPPRISFGSTCSCVMLKLPPADQIAVTPNSCRTTEDTEMWPDLLNPVWPSLPHSLTWPHSFYSSQHTLIESTKGKQQGEKESDCLNILFQRSVSLTKQSNPQQWFLNCWNITSHPATVISFFAWYIFKSSLEPPCFCQQQLRANRTHSWGRIPWYCKRLPYAIDKRVGEFTSLTVTS